MSGGLRILIVGGGIGGLALAAGLRRHGIQPQIVEQAPRFGAVGAGIVLSVNAMAVLRRIDLADAVVRIGEVATQAVITDQRERPLSRADFGALAGQFGPTVAVHRAELHELLVAACADLPLRAGVTVESLVDEGPCVQVAFSDASSGEFDLVIGADGIRSRTRQQVFGPTPPIYSGYTCWRFVAERPAALESTREMWGVGRRLGLVPLSRERVYAFAVANAAEGTLDPEAGRIERLRERFEGFGGAAPALLEQLESSQQLIHNDIEEMAAQAWHRGRVVLLGDAAHATTPNMGQGAAMALEDAAVLTELLASGASVEEALPAFQARREKRVRFVVDQSRRIGRVAQLASPLACALRNSATRWVPDRFAQSALLRLASSAI